MDVKEKGDPTDLVSEYSVSELNTDTEKKRNPRVWHWSSPEISSSHRRSDFLTPEKYDRRPGGRRLGEGYFLPALLPTLEEPLYHIPGNVKWCGHCGKPFDGPQKVKHRTTVWPGHSILRHIPKQLKTLKINTCRPVLIGELFAAAKRWKWPRCPSIDDE